MTIRRVTDEAEYRRLASYVFEKSQPYRNLTHPLNANIGYIHIAHPSDSAKKMLSIIHNNRIYVDDERQVILAINNTGREFRNYGVILLVKDEIAIFNTNGLASTATLFYMSLGLKAQVDAIMGDVDIHTAFVPAELKKQVDSTLALFKEFCESAIKQGDYQIAFLPFIRVNLLEKGEL